MIINSVIENIIKPKQSLPGTCWECVGPYTGSPGYEGFYYIHPDGFVVISSLEVADGITRNEAIPQYHLSISKQGKRRCSSQEAKFIYKQFAMDGCLEDNHTGGFIRSFWLPIDENKIVTLARPMKMVFLVSVWQMTMFQHNQSV